VAIYEYGNSRLSANDGYIRQVLPFTKNLDRVSESLFSLSTNGGEEYCGQVIARSVQDLEWSSSPSDIKVIFIAGNEPFTQGPVNYKTAINSAVAKGIQVNTIHCGGLEPSWQAGALLAKGNFMHIDQNRAVVHVVAPQDDRIAKLNSELNKTYLAYGRKGKKARARQRAQDKIALKDSIANLAKRAFTKVSSFYQNEEWDLVDGLRSGAVELDKINKAALPAEIQGMAISEQREYIKAKAKKRREISAEIKALSMERKNYVAKKKKEMAKADRGNTLESALIQSVKQQARAKNYKF